MVKINPRKAVNAMGDCEIRKANDACYNICAAFSKSSNAWDINPDCEMECEKLVNDLRIKKYGVGWCDHHAPNRPVIWNSNDNFFPMFFDKNKNVKESLNMCFTHCDKTRTPNECKEKCLLHANAIANAIVDTMDSGESNPPNPSETQDARDEIENFSPVQRGNINKRKVCKTNCDLAKYIFIIGMIIIVISILYICPNKK